MGEAVAATVVDFREKRREQREREFRQELRNRGLHTRELVLLHLEAVERDLEHWQRRAQTARFIMGRMFEFLRMAGEREAQSRRLLADALAELERVRGLIA